jgi:hypothetical protein
MLGFKSPPSGDEGIRLSKLYVCFIIAELLLKSWFFTATFTERSQISSALKVGSLQVRTTHEAAHSVAYGRLA